MWRKNRKKTIKCGECGQVSPAGSAHNMRTCGRTARTPTPATGKFPPSSSPNDVPSEEDTRKGITETFNTYVNDFPPPEPEGTIGEELDLENLKDVSTLWELSHTITLAEGESLGQEEELDNDNFVDRFEEGKALGEELEKFAEQFSGTYNFTPQKWVDFFYHNNLLPHVVIHSFAKIPKEGFPNSDAFFEGLTLYLDKTKNSNLSSHIDRESVKAYAAEHPATPSHMLERYTFDILNREDKLYFGNAVYIQPVLGNPKTSNGAVEKILNHVIKHSVSDNFTSDVLKKILNRDSVPETVLLNIAKNAPSAETLFFMLKNPNLPEDALLTIMKRNTQSKPYLVAEIVRYQKNVTPKVEQVIVEQQKRNPSNLVEEALNVRREGNTNGELRTG